MDTRATAEQAELRRAARQLAHDLGPATVRDLDDETRRKRLAGAVRDAGWLELRDDAGDGTPVAGGVEACIVAEALGAAVADVAFTGPVLAADLSRRAGVTAAPLAVVAFGADLVGTGEYPAYAVDAPNDVDTAVVVVRSGEQVQLGSVAAGPVEGATDLTRLVRTIAPGAFVGDISGHLSAADLEQWTALGLALTSADLVGVMRGVLDVTVAYAAERKQYGAAIGSFQAVQHLLADAAALLEGSVSVALHASWAVDDLDPPEALAAGRVAKAYCAGAARTVCETAIQVHGGIGNTWDCIAHVYWRRALLSSQWFGDDAVQLRALERELVGVADGLP
jgi:alkylation response protein AidB-like acyl-CoA dehydrogenase